MATRNVVWDVRDLGPEDGAPSMLAIGDSWFWYFFPGGSLLEQLGSLVATREHVILAVGNNGAEAFDYVQGKYRKQVRTALALYGPTLSAVFISGGGNDFAGFNDLRPLLLKDCTNATSAAACFGPPPEGALYRLMANVEVSYRMLIEQIVSQCTSPAFKGVYLHNYDYPIPSGVGIYSGGGTWLKAALDDARVPTPLQDACMRLLIDQFTAVLQRLVASDPDYVHLIDSRGTLTRVDWANELHPKPAGFRKLALRCWKPVLQQNGLAGDHFIHR